jgi:hypothetical protein
MNKRNNKNDKEVRDQLERVLKLRERYLAATKEKTALGKQGTAEFKKLERLIAGKTK